MAAYLPEDAWVPAHAGVTCCPNCRSQERYVQVVRQFDVETAERYRPKDGLTFCNIFASDVANALGCYLPHWWFGKELSANATRDWLENQGQRYGWERHDEHVAVGAVLAGIFTVASWKNPSGKSGHIAVLLPVPTTGEPWIAQAGRECFAQGSLSRGFGAIKPDFFTCR